METPEHFPDEDFQEEQTYAESLTDAEKQELHLEDELHEMEIFFSKEYDEMELRFY